MSIKKGMMHLQTYQQKMSSVYHKTAESRPKVNLQAHLQKMQGAGKVIMSMQKLINFTGVLFMPKQPRK
jgi:hypothetical protein